MLLDEIMLPGELDELEHFLDSDALPNDHMDLAALDGFLTALVVGPVAVPRSEWWPAIWGTRGGRAIFRSPEEENRIATLVTRFYNEIALCFSVEDGVFEPLFNHYLRVEGKPYVSGMEWCSGFYLGLHLRGEDWEPLCEDEEHADLLMPIFWFVEEGGAWDKVPTRWGAQHEEMLRSIVTSVKAINAYWKGRARLLRRRIKSVRHAPKPRVRDDDRCPCGSGKTLKNCCRFVH